MDRKYSLLAVLGAVIISALLFGCRSAEKQILGKWEDVDKQNAAMEFFPDGKAKVYTTSWLTGPQTILVTYQIKANKLTITNEENVQEFEFSVNDHELKLKVAGEESLLMRSGSKEIAQYRENKLKEKQANLHNNLKLSPAEAKKKLQEMGLDPTEEELSRAAQFCQEDDVPKVDLLLTAGVNSSGVLMEAYANPDCMSSLLAKGADVNQKFQYGETVLMKTSGFGAFGSGDTRSVNVAKMLIDKGADVNAQSDDGTTALIEAARVGNVEIMKMLLSKGARVDAAKDDGTTALIEAAINDEPEAIQLLIAAGANKELKTRNGSTALIAAYDKYKLGAALALIEGGADPNTGSQYGDTPLMYAASRNDVKGVQALLKRKGINVNARSKNGETAVFNSLESVEIMKLLLNSGADPNIPDESGETPLMRASEYGRTDAVQALLEKGANPNARSRWGKDALSLARNGGHTRIAQLIESAGR